MSRPIVHYVRDLNPGIQRHALSRGWCFALGVVVGMAIMAYLAFAVVVR